MAGPGLVGRPIPNSGTDSGLALLVICTVAVYSVSEEATGGVNVTLTVHSAPGARVDVQLLLVKSPETAPETATLMDVTGTSPVLVMKKLLLELPPRVGSFVAGNTTNCVLGTSVWVTVSPTPVRATLCGLPEAVSVNWRDAVRTPVAEGVKLTLTLQALPLPASELVQLFPLMEKSAAFAPVIATEVKLMDASPFRVAVMVLVLLVEPTGSTPKSLVAKLKLRSCTTVCPVPTRLTT
jgi:hypothetical protein